MKFSELVAKWEGGWRGEAISKKTGAKVEFTEESVLFEVAFKGVKLAGEWEPIPKPVPFMEAAKSAVFKEAVKPLEEFVNKYCCPHDIIVVKQGSAELYSGEMVIPLKLLD